MVAPTVSVYTDKKSLPCVRKAFSYVVYTQAINPSP